MEKLTNKAKENLKGVETYSFMVKVYVKGADGECVKHVFKEGWEPGVLAKQVVSFDLKPHDLKSGLFAAELLHHQDALRDSTIGTSIEEYKGDLDEIETGNSGKD